MPARFYALALASLVFATSAAAQTAPQWSAISALQGADRAEKLLDGAKKEAGLTLYSSMTQEDMSAFIVAFEKKYGLKVKLWRGNSEGILHRAMSEARAGRDEQIGRAHV